MNTQSQDVLLYKGDFSKVKQRLRAFWEHEIVDRVCIAVTAPRPEEEQVPLPQPANEQEYQSNLTYYTNMESN